MTILELKIIRNGLVSKRLLDRLYCLTRNVVIGQIDNETISVYHHLKRERTTTGLNQLLVVEVIVDPLIKGDAVVLLEDLYLLRALAGNSHTKEDSALVFES